LIFGIILHDSNINCKTEKKEEGADDEVADTRPIYFTSLEESTDNHRTYQDLTSDNKADFKKEYENYRDSQQIVLNLLKDKDLNIDDMFQGLRDPESPEQYMNMSNLYEKVTTQYKKGGCLTPVLPANMTRTMSDIEKLCHNGHKHGYKLAALHIKLILKDAKKDEKGN